MSHSKLARQLIRCFSLCGVDLIFFAILIMVGLLFVKYPYFFDLHQESSATLAGALFGGAALLLGNGINRYFAERRQAAQLERIKSLITIELENVAYGLIGAKIFASEAIARLKDGAAVSEIQDMGPHKPRQMVFTDQLGERLLSLEKETIDAIVILRSNLAITQQKMDDITSGACFRLLRINSLLDGLRCDMFALAKVFEHIAPSKK